MKYGSVCTIGVTPYWCIIYYYIQMSKHEILIFCKNSLLRFSKWRSEDRINSGIDAHYRWSGSYLDNKRGSAISSGNLMDDEDLAGRSFSSRQQSENDGDPRPRIPRRDSSRLAEGMWKQQSETEEEQRSAKVGPNYVEVRSKKLPRDSYKDRKRRSSVEDVNSDRRSGIVTRRHTVTSSSEDYADRGRASLQRNIRVSDVPVAAILNKKRAGSARSDSVDNSEQEDIDRQITRKSSDSDCRREAAAARRPILPASSTNQTNKIPKSNRVSTEKAVTRQRSEDNVSSLCAAPKSSLTAMKNNKEARGLEEEQEEDWACEHCTFINDAKTKVCIICCKTRSSALSPAPPNELSESSAPTDTSGPSSELLAKPRDGTGSLKISNSEESSDSTNAANSKGRMRRKISFSFETKMPDWIIRHFLLFIFFYIFISLSFLSNCFIILFYLLLGALSFTLMADIRG